VCLQTQASRQSSARRGRLNKDRRESSAKAESSRGVKRPEEPSGGGLEGGEAGGGTC